MSDHSDINSMAYFDEDSNDSVISVRSTSTDTTAGARAVKQNPHAQLKMKVMMKVHGQLNYSRRGIGSS